MRVIAPAAASSVVGVPAVASVLGLQPCRLSPVPSPFVAAPDERARHGSASSPAAAAATSCGSGGGCDQAPGAAAWPAAPRAGRATPAIAATVGCRPDGRCGPRK